MNSENQLSGSNQSDENKSATTQTTVHPQVDGGEESLDNFSDLHRFAKIPEKITKTSAIILILRFIAAVALLIVPKFITLSSTNVLIMEIASAVIIGYDIIWFLLTDLKEKAALRENLPVVAAVLLCFAINKGLYGAIALILLQFSYGLRSYAYHHTAEALLFIDEKPYGKKIISTSLGEGYKDLTQTESKISTFYGYFSIILVLVSTLTLIIAPLVFKQDIYDTISRVVTIIAISSPCGMLFCIPLLYLSAMSSAASLGFVYKNAGALDEMADTSAFVFDKFGTISSPDCVVSSIKTEKMDALTFMKVVAHAAYNSDAIYAKAIKASYKEEINPELISDYEETEGQGLSITIGGLKIHMGSLSYLHSNGIEVPENSISPSFVYMSVNKVFAGTLELAEEVRADSARAIKSLAPEGIERLVMVSGGSRERDRKVADMMQIPEYYLESSLDMKVSSIKAVKNRMDPKHKLSYVGYGEDTEPCVLASDLGIIMCSSEEMENHKFAKAFLVNESLVPLGIAKRIALRLRRSLYFSVAVGMITKALISVLAIAGIAPIWFGMVLNGCVSLGLIVLCLSRASFTAEKKAKEVKALSKN